MVVRIVGNHMCIQFINFFSLNHVQFLRNMGLVVTCNDLGDNFVLLQLHFLRSDKTALSEHFVVLLQVSFCWYVIKTDWRNNLPTLFIINFQHAMICIWCPVIGSSAIYVWKLWKMRQFISCLNCHLVLYNALFLCMLYAGVTTPNITWNAWFFVDARPKINSEYTMRYKNRTYSWIGIF